jgi:hypothetical protein
MDAHAAAGPVVMPRRCPGLASVDLDDEQVVYDPARRCSFRLNRTAGLVLDRCDGRTPRQAVVDELAGAFGADPDQVGTQVGRILEVFDRDGLIEGGDRPGQALAADLDHDWGPPAPPIPSSSAPSSVGPSSVGPSSVGRSGSGGQVDDAGVGWRLALDVAVRVRTDEPDLARGLDPILGSLPAVPLGAPGAGPRLDYELRRTAGGSVDIRVGATSVGDAGSTAAAFSYLQWHLNQQVILHAAGRLLIHAGAVRLASGALVVFPGQSNAGKSTLVAGLVRAGLGYVTDELVALDLQGQDPGRAGGYRKAITLDPGAWPLFADTLAPVVDGVVGTGPPGSPPTGSPGEWLVDPRALDPGAVAGPPEGPVGLIVFPRFELGATTGAEPLSAARGLVELIGHSLNLERTGPTGLATLAGVARRAPAYALTMGGLDAAVERVSVLAQGT